IDEYDLYYGNEAVREQDKPRRERGPLSRRPSVNSIIPAILFSFLFPACTFLFNNSALADSLWASGETVFTRHEYWRLVTSLFTHSGPVHLMSNLPFFIFFGLVLYEYFGLILFPVLPLVIGISANVITLFFYPETTRLIGASGMIYGMVSLWLILYISHDTGKTMPARIFRSAGFTLAVMFPEAYYPSTSYLAHAAGFICGILCGLAVLPFARVKNPVNSGDTAGH
ncbi:MAG TPA: rhomboid family intramembrane serine protease, partial [Spirochaetota bacterium]|nr:rhomboid family intramembrane serine protease [Spirochaetota bacterium]